MAGHPPPSDCATQMRADGQTFSGYAVTTRRPTRKFAVADVVECEDVGEDGAGSVVRDNGAKVQAWSFAGFDIDLILGSRFDSASWQVFFDDSVSSEDKKAMVKELRRPAH